MPLSAIATFERAEVPLVIEHLGQFPATTISFNLAPGASWAQAVNAIMNGREAIEFSGRGDDVFSGLGVAFQNSLCNEVYLLLAALIAVYIVLGVLYESFVHPVTILSTLPSAGIGALIFL